MRLIDADALQMYCEKRHCGSVPLEYIKQLRPVFAEPVKHGRWEMKVIHNTCCFQCSACNSIYSGDTHYCPHCGARMDGGADNGSD